MMSAPAALPPWAGEQEEFEFRLGQAEAELFLVRERLRRTLSEAEDFQVTVGQVLEALPQGLVLTDDHGRVRSLNRAAEELLGVSRSLARGKPYGELWPGRPSPVERLRGGVCTPALAIELRPNSGSLVHLTSQVFWIQLPGGECGGAVEMLTDRTEERRLSRELESVQSLAALGRMAAVAAHEIRNPLGGIAGFLDLVERGLEPADPRRGYTARMREGVEALDRLVTEFLEFSRPVGERREPLDLATLVDRALGELEPLASSRGVRLVTCEPGPTRVEGDADRLRAAVLNLARNAIEATPRGSRVRVRLKPGRDRHRLTLADEGPGVDPRLGRRIFEPFVSGKARGSGLGLALALRAAQLHGGSLRFRNLRPRGAAFSLELPALREEGKRP